MPSAATTSIVAMPTQDAIGSQHEHGKPQDTTLPTDAERRDAYRRRLKIPFLGTWAQESRETRRWKADAERRDASRHDADSERKNPTKISHGKGYGTMLANRQKVSGLKKSRRLQ
jgi:hypothetical protein